MKRRDTVLALLALGTLPFVVKAQPAGKVWRIGVLGLESGPLSYGGAFREQFRTRGYVEGRNFVVESRWAAGNAERLPELAAELVRLKVDAIVAVATLPAAAAKRATNTIPIVLIAADPVGSGLVASLAHPGGNVTGVSLQSTDLAGKRLQLLRELLPRVTRVAVLVLKGSSAGALFLEQTRTAAEPLDMKLVVQEVTTTEGLADAFAAMERERAQALVVQSNPVTTEHRKRVVELAAQFRLPALFEWRIFVDAGGFMSYGPSLAEIFRRAAFYVDQILKGAKPADLPIEQPTKFESVINLTTAKALGLTIPQSVLARVDEVIQ